jgi:hypothetical protein
MPRFASVNEDLILEVGGANDLVLERNGVEVDRRGAEGFGKVLQVVRQQFSELITSAGTIPDDNSIPQSSEGFECMSLSITPKSVNSRILVTVHTLAYASGGDTITSAIFVDSEADSIGAIGCRTTAANILQTMGLNAEYTNTSVTTKTFKVRVGCVSGTTYFNALDGARVYGGKAASSITLWEIAQ